MPKIVDKNVMKAYIVNAALKAFLKYGFHKTTMSKIASEAEIAKGTLYIYFKSKEQLISNITSLHFEKLTSNLITKEYFQTLDDFLQHIENTLLISEADTQFIPIFFEAFGSQFSSADFMKEYKILFHNIGVFYKKNLQFLIDKHQIKDTINPATLGRVLVSMIDGIILHKGFFKMNNTEYKTMIKDAIELFKFGMQEINMEIS